MLRGHIALFNLPMVLFFNQLCMFCTEEIKILRKQENDLEHNVET